MAGQGLTYTFGENINENFVVLFVDSSGNELENLDATITLQSEATSFTTGSNGLSPYFHLLKSGSLNVLIEVDETPLFNAKTVNHVFVFPFQKLEVTVVPKISASIVNSNNFVRWFKINGTISLSSLQEAGGFDLIDET